MLRRGARFEIGQAKSRLTMILPRQQGCGRNGEQLGEGPGRDI
jgi:hypothetical protein